MRNKYYEYILLVKPICDFRFGQKIIASRAGPNANADILMTPEMKSLDIADDVSCVLVDEAQFLTENNVNLLRTISLKIPVIF